LAKVTISEIENLESQTSAVQAINQNFEAIQDAIENTVSRDGTTPNSMSGTLDMNSNRIINLPEPVDNTDPVRLVDIGGLTGLDLGDISEIAEQVAEDAASAAASAAEAAGYVGAASQAPKWTTARSITFSGSDVTGTSPTWDGSANLTWTGVSIASGAVTAAKFASGAVVAHLGYTPAALTGATFTGDVRLNFTATSLNSDSVGFRGIPINTQDAAYTFLVNDIGRMVRHTSASAHVYTIESTGTVAYPVGATIVVRNVGAGAITLNRAIGVTLRKAGVATDANLTLAQWGVATLIHEATNTWMATGTGIT
jgi:hypothetical protein